MNIVNLFLITLCNNICHNNIVSEIKSNENAPPIKCTKMFSAVIWYFSTVKSCSIYYSFAICPIIDRWSEDKATKTLIVKMKVTKPVFEGVFNYASTRAKTVY